MEKTDMSNEYDVHLMEMGSVQRELTNQMKEEELNYSRALESGDRYAIRQAEYNLLDCRSRLRELANTYNEYTAPPPAPTPVSREARGNRQWQEMDAVDWVNLWGTGKNGAGVDLRDPNVQKCFEQNPGSRAAFENAMKNWKG
jgi:hypothetical protein